MTDVQLYTGCGTLLTDKVIVAEVIGLLARFLIITDTGSGTPTSNEKGILCIPTVLAPFVVVPVVLRTTVKTESRRTAGLQAESLAVI